MNTTNAYSNKTGKLLVAVLAMTMIVAGAAVMFSSSEANADDIPGLTQTTVDSWGEEYVATGNITLGGNVDLGNKTLDMGKFTLNTNGFNITGGTIKGTTAGNLNSGCMVQLKPGTAGASSITNTVFVSEATDNHLPGAAIIIFDNVEATITGCTFTVEGETNYTNFGAVQVNNYNNGNAETSTTFTDCNFGDGIITYNPGQGREAGAPVEFNNCGAIILNFIYNVTLDGKNIIINSPTTVSQTILGWSASTANTDKYGGSVDVTVSAESPIVLSYADDGLYGEYLLVDLYTPTGLNQADAKEPYIYGRSTFSKAGIRVYEVNSTLARGRENQYVPYVGEPDYEATYLSANGSQQKYSYAYRHSNSSVNPLSEYGIMDKEPLLSLLSKKGMNRHITDFNVSLSDDDLFHAGDAFDQGDVPGFYKDFAFDSGTALGITFTVKSIDEASGSAVLTLRRAN